MEKGVDAHPLGLHRLTGFSVQSLHSCTTFVHEHSLSIERTSRESQDAKHVHNMYTGFRHTQKSQLMHGGYGKEQFYLNFPILLLQWRNNAGENSWAVPQWKWLEQDGGIKPWGHCIRNKHSSIAHSFPTSNVGLEQFHSFLFTQAHIYSKIDTPQH